MFAELKQLLKGRFSDDVVELEGVLSQTLMSMELDMLMKVFANWKYWLQQCIDQGGDYL
jgi:hypothetical protein